MGLLAATVCVLILAPSAAQAADDPEVPSSKEIKTPGGDEYSEWVELKSEGRRRLIVEPGANDVYVQYKVTKDDDKPTLRRQSGKMILDLPADKIFVRVKTGYPATVKLRFY